MPYFGLLSFLRSSHSSRKLKSYCFNALLRASFFSTAIIQTNYHLQRNVSMPYFGLLSFLQTIAKLAFNKLFGFQCPTSGFFLFYLYTQVIIKIEMYCFNALLRASFFSTNSGRGCSIRMGVFQCPTSGFFLFYKAKKYFI